MIVINRKSVVGQIKEVFPKSVEFFQYAKGNIVPAYINSNGLNIILKGLGEDKLFSIENLSSDVDLKIGDEIFSSGLGGKFPKGYLIGKIKKISNNPNLKFQTVEVNLLQFLIMDQKFCLFLHDDFIDQAITVYLTIGLTIVFLRF